MARSQVIASLLLYLRPLHPASLGTHPGRSLHGLFLNLLADADPVLADRMHRPMRVKPFTVSSLMGRLSREANRLVATPDECYRVRYTTLSDEVFSALSQVLLERYLHGRPVEIDRNLFAIEKISVDPQETGGWGRVTTFEALLKQHEAEREIRIRFYSPTAFKTGDVTLLFPLPRSVFRSYQQAWEAFSQVPLSEDLMTFVEKHVTVSRYALRTDVIRTEKFSLLGFVGTCTFRILRDDPVRVRELNALANLALFVGTGMKTTQGMGQTRRLDLSIRPNDASG